MRSTSLLTALAILAVGGASALGNLWFSAKRSLIPLALDTTVEDRWRAYEKHPGVDDVRVLILPGGDGVEVDEAPYRMCVKGARIGKTAWERTLWVDKKPIPLSWSADARGMAVVMPLAGALLLLVLGAGLRSRRAGAAGRSPGT